MSTDEHTNTLQSSGMSGWGLMRRLLKGYVRPYFGRLLTALLFMLIAAAMTAAFAKLIEPILDKVMTDGNTNLVWPMSLAVFACFVIRGVATYIHTLLMNKVGQDIVADMQQNLFSGFLDLDLVFFHKNPSGELTSRIVNDVNIVRNAITSSFTGFGKNLLTLVFLVALMFYQDWVLSLLAFVAMPAGGIFVVYIGKRLRKLSGTIQEEIASLSHVFNQIFQGIRQVKAYNKEDFERARSLARIQQLKKHIIKSVRLATLSTPFNEGLIGLALMGLIVYGGHKVAAGNMTTGELMSFIAAFSLAYEPMKKLAKLNNVLQMGLGAAERVFDMMDLQPAIADKGDAKTIDANKIDITFDQVSFSYGEDEGYALNSVSFTAKSGSVTALVGASGSGKTTALNLVPRFYDVTGGRILINGTNIQDIKLGSLRDHVALVSQDIMIFDDTVKANIAYGRDNATDEQIMQAAKAAAAEEFILAMPEGFDTHLGEQGVKLSGGQRQRIAIARAILRDAPILLLDEATSALDTESEKLIQQSLQELQKGRTVLVIAHRLTTVQDADHIIVLQNGQIAEEGSHDALIRLNKLYALMYQGGLQDV